MRQLIAALGVCMFAASASAQYPSPAAAAGTPVGPGPGAVFVPPISKHTVAGGYFTTYAAFGDPRANNGAGSLVSDHAFVFGSTRSFFSPCGPYLGAPCKPLFNRKPAPSNKCEYETFLK